MQLFDGALSLEVPSQCDNQTVYTFVAADAQASGFRSTILVARGPLPAGISLEPLARAQLAMSSNQLPQFALLAEKQGVLDGQFSIEWTVTFAADAVGLHVQQRQVFVAGKHADFYVLTAAGLPTDAFIFDEFDKLLASLRVA